MQLCKEPKNGFLMAKQGLSLHGNLKTNLVSFGENRRGEEGEKREEEEEKKRRRGDQASQRYGYLDFGMETTLSMDLTLDMNSIMNHMDFVWDSREVYEFQI